MALASLRVCTLPVRVFQKPESRKLRYFLFHDCQTFQFYGFPAFLYKPGSRKVHLLNQKPFKNRVSWESGYVVNSVCDFWASSLPFRRSKAYSSCIRPALLQPELTALLNVSSGQRKDFGDLKGLHQGSEIQLKPVLCSRLQGCLGQVLYMFGLGTMKMCQFCPEKNVVNG